MRTQLQISSGPLTSQDEGPTPLSAIDDPSRSEPFSAPETDPEPKYAGLATSNAKRMLGFVVAMLALSFCVVLSLAVGAKWIAPVDVFNSIRGIGTPENMVIVNDLRVPRTLIGLLTGLALAVAGALIQALTRNPLADPGILGVNAGAAFAVVIAVAVFGLVNITDYIWFSFGGAIISTLLVYLISSRGRAGATPIKLTLAGVALGAVLGGVSSGITLLNPEAFDRMRYWGAGTLNNRTLEMVLVVLPFILLGTCLAFFCTRSLNAISLGDDLAQALGSNVQRTRITVIVAVTLLCGAATAAAGPIGFVGLMIPHIARWIVGADQRWIVIYSLALGPVLLLLADVIGRIAVPPGELQVGIVTAFVGAPVLILLVRRKKVSGL
ncbi:iron chelate uptake ABC transporter family permease subunit [Glutamicibacter sp.]|uniref:iron chelate uptake ABC transporter family permease subunit n=1 Tax=Glutamicibacter sp. TaxID=1931995 RepID=UPI002B46E724|nr:iron chelate uptake ABC transporter family permease subunit [Glutamicibacter sp.]HJX78620.1 iron chelate uptake ABC transporter family permease subunit [Glutamicibacter sp.]